MAGMTSYLYRAFLKLPVTSRSFVSTGDTDISERFIENNSRRLVRADFPPMLFRFLQNTLLAARIEMKQFCVRGVLYV